MDKREIDRTSGAMNRQGVDLARLRSAMTKVQAAQKDTRPGQARRAPSRPLKLPPPPEGRDELLAELGLGPAVKKSQKAETHRLPIWLEKTYRVGPRRIGSMVIAATLLATVPLAWYGHAQIDVGEAPQVQEAFSNAAVKEAPSAQPVGSFETNAISHVEMSSAPRPLSDIAMVDLMARDIAQPSKPTSPSPLLERLQVAKLEMSEAALASRVNQSPTIIRTTIAPKLALATGQNTPGLPKSLPKPAAHSIAEGIRPQHRPARAAMFVTADKLQRVTDFDDLRVVIHYPISSGSEKSKQVARQLRASGTGEVEIRAVDFNVATPSVRYFRSEDFSASKTIRGMAFGNKPAKVANFTSYNPAPRAGTIELWIP